VKCSLNKNLKGIICLEAFSIRNTRRAKLWHFEESTPKHIQTRLVFYI